MTKRTPQNKGQRVLERPDGDIEVQELEVDPLPDLVAGGGGTTVSASVGYSYQPFAVAKCSVHITLGCDQTTDTMDRAAHIALRMAREYALDGMETIREDVQSERFHIPEEYRSS